MDVVSLLIVINCIVYFIPYLFDFSGGSQDSFGTFLALGWNSASEIRDGDIYRLFTSMFLHGDIMHLLFNMISLWQVGRFILLPQVFGLSGFLIIYFTSGLAGSLASFLFHPMVPSVGASGAIMGLVGALLSYALIVGDSSLFSQIFINIIIIFAIGFMSGGRIDNWGHLGGLVSGIALGAVLSYR